MVGRKSGAQVEGGYFYRDKEYFHQSPHLWGQRGDGRRVWMCPSLRWGREKHRVGWTWIWEDSHLKIACRFFRSNAIVYLSEQTKFWKTFFFFFYFTILYWFYHTLTWVHHGCTWVPNPEPPSHLPPHIISLGHPSAPAPSILYPVSNLDWRFVSYMIVYMVQCHSPKSSHPLPLLQSPKDCSIHLCLFCSNVLFNNV